MQGRSSKGLFSGQKSNEENEQNYDDENSVNKRNIVVLENPDISVVKENQPKWTISQRYEYPDSKKTYEDQNSSAKWINLREVLPPVNNDSNKLF